MRRIALWMLLSALATPSALAQLVARPANQAAPALVPARSAEADLVRGWYRDYLGREVGPELSAWVELLRGGMPPIDVQATILGSDEFYYQKGRDPQTFVLETLQAVTWADPTVSELRRWTNRLSQLSGDRLTVAREILLASSQPTSDSSQAAEIAGRLSTAARLAVDTVDFEISGTAQGRQARLQAQSLLDAAGQLQRAAGLRPARPDEVLVALNSADRAYQALQSTLSNPPGTAPSAAAIVRRIGTMLTDARAAIAPTTPEPITGGGPAAGSQQLLEQVTAAKRGAESLIQTLTSQAYQNYSFSVILRDLDALASRLTSLEQSVRGGMSRERLAWEVQSLRDLADRIEPQLLAGRPPYFTRLYWQSVTSSLDQLRQTLGSPGGAGGGPATVLRPTVLHRNLVPLVDQALSQIDVFLAGTNPLVFGIPDVPSVQRDVRTLRTRVLTLRQQADAAEPASTLKQTLASMVGDYQRAFDRWNQIVAGQRLINPARLSPVGETLNRVEQMINDALASGEVSPTGPARSGQLLASLRTEVSEARRALAAFAGYREQQSIDLYLQQLEGYVQSISDALARSTTVDARRLAVGMQGVIGRMQSEIDSLGQRAGSAAARDLRSRAERIGQLVDSLEAELY